MTFKIYLCYIHIMKTLLMLILLLLPLITKGTDDSLRYTLPLDTTKNIKENTIETVCFNYLGVYEFVNHARHAGDLARTPT